jgi:hypothetical protein
MIYKTLHRKLKIEHLWWIRVITKLPTSEQSYKGKVKTHKYINRQNQCAQVLQKTNQSQRFCYSCYKDGDESWKKKGLDFDNDKRHLWHRYSVMVDQVMVVTITFSKWWLHLDH